MAWKTLYALGIIKRKELVNKQTNKKRITQEIELMKIKEKTPGSDIHP